MRKLKIIAIMAALFMVLLSCGSIPISFTSPTAQDLVQIAAKATGYEIGKGDPIKAGEIAKRTQPDTANILEYWPKWRSYLASRLTDDEFYRSIVENMLARVKLKAELDVSTEQVETMRSVLRGFKEGLEAGIKDNN